MRWAWTEAKNHANRRKHGLGFETARLVFEDPLAAHRPDRDSDEERWHTIGAIRGVVIVVAHTWPRAASSADAEIGRIISARKATVHERRAYEEGTFQDPH